MKNQQQATRIYADHVTGIKAMLKRLSEAGDRDFFTDAATVNWADVGSIEHLAHKLRDICDMTFNEGEYADSNYSRQGTLYEAH
ncbi:MAG: hypothetical protein KGI29_05245 [Pseudomonadota bacterium]|nr:hypothetical protein [Pseudomonadota bacterium]MDE3037021.1 hypothetical protein [Pseudomonadota bacterium]